MWGSFGTKSNPFLFFGKDEHAMDCYNISNILTFSRIAVTPLLLYLFFVENFYVRILVLILVILSEITDLVDGYLARKRNIVTDLGKVIDPLADRLFRLTMFLCFLQAGLIHVWFFALCFYRDAIVTTLRIIAINNSIVFSAKWSGKLKAVVQAIAVIFILLLTIFYFGEYPDWMTTVTNSVMLVVTVVTLLSGIDYFCKIKRMLQQQES